MGKKQKSNNEEGPTLGPVKDKDTMQRLNFLYQTSVYLAQVAGTDPGPSTRSPEEGQSDLNESRSKSRRKSSMMDLSRTHLRNMKVIGAKAVLRMDPSVKRTICKGCQAVLVPGVTAKVRTKPSRTHKHITRYICLQCKTSKGIPSPPIRAPEAEEPPTMPPSGEGEASAKPCKTRPKRKDKRWRPPPLFERDVGHVLAIGNSGRPSTTFKPD